MGDYRCLCKNGIPGLDDHLIMVNLSSELLCYQQLNLDSFAISNIHYFVSIQHDRMHKMLNHCILDTADESSPKNINHKHTDISS